MSSELVCPNPSKCVGEVTLADGTVLGIRPIRREDEPLVVKFHASLSEQSVYRRYFELLDLATRTRHERLKRICSIDYRREMVVIAEHEGSKGDSGIVGVGRLMKNPEQCEAELAIVVSDGFQRRGIGSRLAEHLIDFAREEHFTALTAMVLFENRPMQKLLVGHGFTFSDTHDGVLEGRLRL
ncbi:MAG: GNAT family N-acetyltransferase [Acidobacteriaceae bacterium]|nr:GNAT family N-acetyltransferase [Acidobacteriaceae bacterium]